MSEALSPAAQTLNSVLGFETIEVGRDRARARVEVGDRHRQPYGIVHGGVYAALAESIASVATAAGTESRKRFVIGSLRSRPKARVEIRMPGGA